MTTGNRLWTLRMAVQRKRHKIAQPAVGLLMLVLYYFSDPGGIIHKVKRNTGKHG